MLQTPIVEIRPFKEVDLSGGVVIEAFPSAGLSSTVLGMHLISSLRLDEIAAIDSPWFPPTSMIYAYEPKFPARICANGLNKIAVCLSEFTMPAHLDRYVAKSILSWANEQKCSLVITLCSMTLPQQGGESHEPRATVLGVGLNDQTRQTLKNNGISLLDFGVVPGITGALLNESKWSSTDVIALVVVSESEVQDARVAGLMGEAIDLLLPQIDLEIAPLYARAEEIEVRLRALREQAKPARPSGGPSPYA